MLATPTRKGLRVRLRVLARALGDMAEAPELDRLLSTPDPVDWVETSLTRHEQDVMLRKGLVRRPHGQP
jgi:hypothetical protein